MVLITSGEICSLQDLPTAFISYCLLYENIIRLYAHFSESNNILYEWKIVVKLYEVHNSVHLHTIVE